MIAYLYGLPTVGLIHAPGVPLPQDDVKQFIVAHSHRRVPPSPFAPQGWLTTPNLNVIYNLANGDPAHQENPCAIDFGKRQEGVVSACSATATASSSTSEPSARYVSHRHCLFTLADIVEVTRQQRQLRLRRRLRNQVQNRQHLRKKKFHIVLPPKMARLLKHLRSSFKA
jgi:hypothetical protein